MDKVSVIITFFFITDAARKKLERLLSGKSFQRSLIFPIKARCQPSGATFRCYHL